ncbi:hypothetical protein Tco_1513561, partial [Tanacetum coccineum]
MSILHAKKLIGSNFTNWHRNLRIVLMYEKKLKLKLAHLEKPLIPLPLLVASQAARNAYDMQNEVACLMLGIKAVYKLLSLEDEKLLRQLGTPCIRKTIAKLHAMLKLYEKGIPKEAKTLAVLAIREGRFHKDKKKPQGEKVRTSKRICLLMLPSPRSYRHLRDNIWQRTLSATTAN